MIVPTSLPHRSRSGAETWDASTSSSSAAVFARSGLPVGEEILQQCAALCLEDTAAYLDTMVEPWIPYDVKKRADRAGLWIEGAEDQPRDAGQYERAGAHGARLECDDEREAGQPPRSQPPGGLPQRKELGMRRRIMPDLTFVARGRKDITSLVEDDRADRNIAVSGGQPGLIERQQHRVIPLTQTAEFTHPQLLRRTCGTAD